MEKVSYLNNLPFSFYSPFILSFIIIYIYTNDNSFHHNYDKEKYRLYVYIKRIVLIMESINIKSMYQITQIKCQTLAIIYCTATDLI